MKDDFSNYIIKVAEGLGDTLDGIVFIGGTASYLYHYKFETGIPLVTYDLDALVDKRKLKTGLRYKIESMGFDEIPSLPPEKSSGKFINKEWKQAGKLIKIEILLPMKGAPTAKGTVETGLKAEQLRYVDILLDKVWIIKIGNGLKINVPHPARYLLQKLLAYDKRPTSDKEKDTAYIADVLNLFFSQLPLLVAEIKTIHEQNLQIPEKKAWVKRAVEKYKVLFGDSYADGIEYANKQLSILSIGQITAQSGAFLAELEKITQS